MNERDYVKVFVAASVGGNVGSVISASLLCFNAIGPSHRALRVIGKLSS